MNKPKKRGRKPIQRSPDDFIGKIYKSKGWGDIRIEKVIEWNEKFKRPKKVLARFVDTDNFYIYNFMHIAQGRAVDLKYKTTLPKKPLCPSLQERKDYKRHRQKVRSVKRYRKKNEFRNYQNIITLVNKIEGYLVNFQVKRTQEEYIDLTFKLHVAFSELMDISLEKAREIYNRYDLEKYLEQLNTYENARAKISDKD